MPRISAERREARRAEIVGAARRCFAREGFHQTSMPDIAAEAGLAVGAPYRYFASKEEIILEIASEAFGLIFDPVEQFADGAEVTVADLVTAALDPISGDRAPDRSGESVSVQELLRCAVQAWAELLRNDVLRERANLGVDRVRRRIADALLRGQRNGTVRHDLDPDHGARMIIALLHGFVLQRTAFGLEDTDGFLRDVRSALSMTGPLHDGSTGRS